MNVTQYVVDIFDVIWSGVIQYVYCRHVVISAKKSLKNEKYQNMKVYPEGTKFKNGFQGTGPGKSQVSDGGGLSLLATSLRHQTTEFFNNSTLHGVRYIAEKERPFCEK